MNKEFVRWFLHGNINSDIVVNGMGWVLIFFFIGFPCILLCLAYYALVGSTNTRSLSPSEGQKAKRR